MSVELLQVGSFRGAAAAAALLARTRHVHLDTQSTGEPAPIGFLTGPDAIAFWTSTEREPPPEVDEQLGALAESGVDLCLYDVESFGADRLTEQVYFPLFVRLSYCVGAAPFPLNLSNFRRLADPRALLAVGSVGGAPVAAALLRPAVRGDTPHIGSPLPVDREDVVEIVASGVHPNFPGGEAVFFFAVSGMLAAQGYPWVWVRELPWVTSRRASFWTEAALRADHVAHMRSRERHYAWNPDLFAEGEGVLFLEALLPTSFLQCHTFGGAHGMFAAARQHLSSRGVNVTT